MSQRTGDCSKWLPAAIFGGVLVLYLVSASTVAADGDGLKETQLAEAAGHGLRAYHLWHTALNRAVLDVWRALGLGGRSFVPLQVLNAVAGALSAALVWLLGRRLGLSPPRRDLITAVWVVSYTPWLHSRTAETAMTPLPLWLAAILLLLPDTPLAARAAWPRAVLAAALCALAVLLSLNMVILAPALLAALPSLCRPGRGRVWVALAAAGVYAVVVLAPYKWAVTDVLQLPSAEWWTWLTHHEDTKGLSASGGPVTGLMRAVIGVGRLVFPASAGETAAKAILRRQQVDVTWVDGVTLGRNLLAGMSLVLLALLGAGRSWRRSEFRPLLVALAVSAAFNLLWLGSEPQYWLPVYPVLLVLAAVAWPERVPEELTVAQQEARSGATSGAARPRPESPPSHFRKRAPSHLWKRAPSHLLVAVLAVTNRVSTVPTLLSPGWGPEWRRAAAFATALPPGDALVIVPGNTALRRVPALRPGVTTLDLTYDAPEGLEGDAFLAWVGERIDAALAADEAVYIDNLAEPLLPEALGPYEMMRGTHRVDRRELAEALARRYRLTPVPALDRHALRIDARAPAPRSPAPPANPEAMPR